MKLQSKVIIISVAGHRRLATVTPLVHLESAGHVLGVAHHGHGYVAHKYCPYHGVLFLRVHADECGANAVGHLPAVNHYVGLHAVQLFHC